MGFHTQRINNLLQTLRFLKKDHKEICGQSQAIILCTDDSGRLKKPLLRELEELKAIFKEHEQHDLKSKEMILPKLTNFGVSRAKSEKLLIIESDRILPPGYFEKVIETLEPGLNITCQYMKKLKYDATDKMILNNQFHFIEEWRSNSNEIGMRNMWSGNTAVHIQDYLKAGKMNEDYVGYGWADTDMCERMKSIDIECIFLEGFTELHLWHPPMTYGIDDQKLQFIENGLRYCNTWNKKKPLWFLKELQSHNMLTEQSDIELLEEYENESTEDTESLNENESTEDK